MCGGKVAIPPIVKEKRRNSEKRKEKSRDAARCRRSKESEIFTDLSSQLPLSQNMASTLDKSSIMRLAVGYLKVKEMIGIITRFSKPKLENRPAEEVAPDPVFAAVLDGFLLVLSEEGDIIFLSQNVEEFIGISQMEMMGHSIYEFSHPCDHEEIKAYLAAKSSKFADGPREEPVSFFIRMKTTLKPSRRTMNLKSATYQVIHYIGHKLNKPSKGGDDSCPTFYLIFIGKTLPLHIDVPLDKDIFFLSRHSPDMKFTYIDEKITELVGYTAAELLGQSVYFYHHTLDAFEVLSAFQTLFHKGQCETGHYRFLAKHGGYVWVVTQATLIGENAAKPECVVCLNYVLSKTENQHELLSAVQEKPEEVVVVSEEREAPEETKRPVAKEVPRPLAKPPVVISSTSAIFAPKATVMSKDFLSFPETDILLCQESYKDSKLNLGLDLFQDEPCTIGSNILDDPFISYRDDSLSSPSYCGTPESSLNLHPSNSTSPNHFSTTPSTPDSGSLSDLPSLDPIDEFSNLDLKFTMAPSLSDKDSDCYEEDMDFRAPFISMNMDDDFPLISPSSSVMWGPQEPAPKKPAPERLPDPEPQRISPPKPKPNTEANMKSSLAALLQSDLKKTPQTKDKGIISRKDTSKRWQNSSAENNRNNSKHNKNIASSRSYGNGNSNSSGHIIMLDSLPVKKQPSKSNASQKRNGHVVTTTSDHRSNSPPFRSHTAMVKVHDRVIKVQVSVSEFSSPSIECKQPFPSPPDPPPKRTSPSRPGPTESPKRLKMDNGLLSSGQQGISNSVLLNLLVRGEDASHGYLCSGNSRYTETKYQPVQLSLPSSETSETTDSSSSCTDELLSSESELLDSFLKISHYDAEIQSAHLLQGDDLLSALDHQPLLRNVPAMV